MYDRLFYNATLLEAEVAQVDLLDVTIEDGTPWRDFVDPQPLDVIVFGERMEFKLHPWYNLEEIEPEYDRARCCAPGKPNHNPGRVSNPIRL